MGVNAGVLLGAWFGAGLCLATVEAAGHRVPSAEEQARFTDGSRWPQGAPNAWYAGPGRERERKVGSSERIQPGTDIELGGTNEPASAVNPGNPDQVAYASGYQLRVSTDGGQTFAPGVASPMPSGFDWCGDASLAWDSQGRLFWTYLGCLCGYDGYDIFVVQVDPLTGNVLPGYPVNVTEQLGLSGCSIYHDKEWLAADSWTASPFRDRLYIAWTRFPSPTTVLNTWSSDQGLTWQPAVTLSDPAEGFVWPVHNAVSFTGDYYVGYHAQPGWAGGAPDGVSGRQIVHRSSDGGRIFPQQSEAFAAGLADITFNRQDSAGTIPDTTFWLQGSAQPFLLPDPKVAGRVLVLSNDDPDNDHGSGEHAQVFLAESLDFGQTWTAPRRIDSGPPGSFAVMPAAALDPETAIMAITWYDNRNGQKNASGRWLLDLFETVSPDGGRSWAPELQVNDVAFDPDPGAPIRFGGPRPTTRIGEYNGLAISSCFSLPTWCGNTTSGGVPVGQQSLVDTPDADAPVGAVGNTLRAMHASGDVLLSWNARTVNPPLFNLHRASSKYEIDKGAYLAIPLNPLPVGGGGLVDAGALSGPGGEIYLYESFASTCAGTSIIR